MVLKRVEGGGVQFLCPGCKHHHIVWVQPGPQGRHTWGWNGSMEKPTFSPSLNITSGCKTPQHKEGTPCWCTYNAEHKDQPAPFECGICHTFIVDGNIQFLADCTHHLKGQTVPLPQLES